MSGCIRVGVTEAALNPDYANVCGNRGGEKCRDDLAKLEDEIFFLSREIISFRYFFNWD